MVMDLSDSKVEELISCTKRIVIMPKRQGAKRPGYTQNTMELISIDAEHRFSVFLLQIDYFFERFSIGLSIIIENSSERPLLFRCNGGHGLHTNKVIDFKTIAADQPHEHRRTEAALNAGLDEMNFAVAVPDYFSYEQALTYFCRRAHITDSERFIPSNEHQPAFDL